MNLTPTTLTTAQAAKLERLIEGLHQKARGIDADIRARRLNAAAAAPLKAERDARLVNRANRKLALAVGIPNEQITAAEKEHGRDAVLAELERMAKAAGLHIR